MDSEPFSANMQRASSVCQTLRRYRHSWEWMDLIPPLWWGGSLSGTTHNVFSSTRSTAFTVYRRPCLYPLGGGVALFQSVYVVYSPRKFETGSTVKPTPARFLCFRWVYVWDLQAQQDPYAYMDSVVEQTPGTQSDLFHEMHLGHFLPEANFSWEHSVFIS